MFLEEHKVELIGTATAAGTTTITSSEIDCLGCTGVTFVAYLGTAAADNTIKVQHSDSTGTDMADVADSEIGAASKTVTFCEIYKPTKRYMQVVVTRATSTTIEAVFAIKSYGKKKPRTHASASVSAQTLISPVSGTA